MHFLGAVTTYTVSKAVGSEVVYAGSSSAAMSLTNRGGEVETKVSYKLTEKMSKAHGRKNNVNPAEGRTMQV